jgi:alpha-1,2-mannosyltransferase
VRWRNLSYWAAVSVCVELAVGELIGWLRFALTSNLQGPDFYTYYAISLLLLRRGPVAVYDFAVQKQFQEQVTSQWPGHFILLPHILPPWVTLIFYPLALLPYRASYLAWGASILLLVGAAIAMLLGAAGLKGRGAVLGAAAAAASLPVLVLLLQGQSDAPMIAAVAAAALAWTGRHPARAGAFAALGLVKPQLILLLPVLFLVRRSWRAVAAFSAGGLLLVLLSLTVFGPEACLAWLRILAPWAFAGQANFPVDTQAQFSLRGLVQLVGVPLVLQLALLGLGLLALAAVLLRSRADPRLELALAIVGSMALSPYQHAHDLALLIVPGLLLGGALPVLRHRRLGAGILLGGWIGLELLLLAPVLTALAIVATAVFLAWECLAAGPAQVGREGPAVAAAAV